MSLSVPGLWGAWNILVKGTLGVAATGLLVATTDVRDLLQALDRLHVPKAFTAITSFMIRYGELITGELRADADRADLAWARPAVDLAGARRCGDRGHAVHPLLRARRACVPRDGVARLRRRRAQEPNAHARRRDWAVALSLPAFASSIAGVAAWT